jgi:mono/diheme cytochrome c family protein
VNAEEKRRYLEEYGEAKKHGIPFFPDAVFKDAVVMLIVFIVLVGLSYVFGASLEARANPADTSYTPRPEWYFLFIFQLLKYFPGSLEFVGVVMIPTVAILALVALPYLDRSSHRHPFTRPWVMGATMLSVAGVGALTVLAVISQPPPTGPETGDQVAALYADNCAGCHGPSIDAPPGTDLHAIIAQGTHEGMPGWSGDLSTDEIDALAGYINSPNGDLVFRDQCAECHLVTDLAGGDPFDLRAAIQNDPEFAPHAGLELPDWSTELSDAERTSLLNFLVAPDGQRLYTENCASCHGTAVVFSGTEDELRQTIVEGGRHRSMPQWSGVLSDAEIDELARYVVDPASVPQAEALFSDKCSSCHGARIPQESSVEAARTAIATGGAHIAMPVWGQVLTPDQIDALVAYTEQAAQGSGIEKGQVLFQSNCAPCHGEFGEGGVLPGSNGRVIAPISTLEFLSTRDDATIRAIITSGQPGLGMSPFGVSQGGPLSDDDVDGLVAFIRSWQANPPVEFPPEIAAPINQDSTTVYAEFCAQCHGSNGEGGIGPSFQSPDFQAQSDEEIFTTIHDGHQATAMIAWGDLLTTSTINDLVRQLRSFAGQSSQSTFERVQQVFEAHCTICHGTSGGWDASTYATTMETGDHAPVIVPGDADASLLVQKLRNTQPEGGSMPPGGSTLSDADIALIVEWINSGAKP